MKHLFALLLILATSPLWGQGSVVTGTPVVANPLGQPIPGATVAVCTTDPGSPTVGGCPGHLATIYTDVTIGTACTGTGQPLSNPGGIGSGCSNPGLADGRGNAIAFAAQGQYWCEYYGTGILVVQVIPCIFPSTSLSSIFSSNPTGLIPLYTFQALGNGSTVNTLLNGLGWVAMIVGADLSPSGSTNLEDDGVFGIVEGQSTTTSIVGVRGQGQAGANNVATWGGNFLCTDYDHAGATKTGVKCTGLETDVNTKSTTSTGAGHTLIENGPAAPAAAFPAINILGQNGGQWFNGVIVNNGATSSGQAFFAGSQGATGVINKASQYMEFDGSNGAGTARAAQIEASKDGDFLIFPAKNVGIGVGGTLASPNQPITLLANTTSNNQDNTAQGANGSGIEWQVGGAGYSGVFNNSSAAAGSYGFLTRIAATTGTNRIFTAASGSNDVLVITPTNATALAYATTTNCSSSASPAVCGSAAAGNAVIAAAATTVVVNTSAVTASSQILITRDNSLGTKLTVTCNTQSSLTLGTPYVSARSAGVSFTLTLDVAPTTNPLCFSYSVIN